jgi:hypothetical protein
MTVQRMKRAGSSRYNDPTLVPDGAPVAVSCSARPLSADESTLLGLQADTVYEVSANSWPGGLYSKIAWDGRDWSQRGETKHHTRGVGTRRDTAVIVADSAEVH